MSIVHDLRQTSRLGLLVGGAAATIGVIYGYDLSNIAGALLFITDQIHLSTPQQELGVLGGWCFSRVVEPGGVTALGE